MKQSKHDNHFIFTFISLVDIFWSKWKIIQSRRWFTSNLCIVSKIIILESLKSKIIFSFSMLNELLLNSYELVLLRTSWSLKLKRKTIYKNEQVVVKTFDLKIAQNRYDFEIIKAHNFLFNSMHISHRSIIFNQDIFLKRWIVIVFQFKKKTLAFVMNIIFTLLNFNSKLNDVESFVVVVKSTQNDFIIMIVEILIIIFVICQDILLVKMNHVHSLFVQQQRNSWISKNTNVNRLCFELRHYAKIVQFLNSSLWSFKLQNLQTSEHVFMMIKRSFSRQNLLDMSNRHDVFFSNALKQIKLIMILNDVFDKITTLHTKVD